MTKETKVTKKKHVVLSHYFNYFDQVTLLARIKNIINFKTSHL
jgi:hypothetical protein